MIRWDTCRREFEPDGTLRDIYVHSTTIEHWRTLFDALRATYALEYSIDSSARPLPAVVDEAFTTRDTASPSLRFLVGGIVVACHFFTTVEIEFDISPGEVTSQAALDELLGFLRLVGDTLGKAVGLSYEGHAQHPFITYEPSKREFQFHEVAA
jgi:hypothetical protein